MSFRYQRKFKDGSEVLQELLRRKAWADTRALEIKAFLVGVTEYILLGDYFLAHLNYEYAVGKTPPSQVYGIPLEIQVEDGIGMLVNHNTAMRLASERFQERREEISHFTPWCSKPK